MPGERGSLSCRPSDTTVPDGGGDGSFGSRTPTQLHLADDATTHCDYPEGVAIDRRHFETLRPLSVYYDIFIN